MWIVENPWPPMILAAIAGGLCLFVGLRGRRGATIAGAVLVSLCPLFWIVDQAVVTDSERVEQRVRDMADAFVRNDAEAFLAFFDPRNKALRGTARTALLLVDLRSLSIKDMTVTDAGEAAQGRTLRSRFRANGEVSAAGVSAGPQTSRWDLDWQLRDGQWTVVAVRRLHPLKDEEVQILNGQ